MADVQIELDARATPEEIAGVRAAFDSIGKDAEVDATWEKPPGIGNGPMWMLIVVLGIPIAAFLKSFAGKLGEEAGAAAATEFRQFIRSLRNARKASYASDGWIRLKGKKKTEVAIAASLPDDALDALYEVDWSRVQGRVLIWDHDRKIWVAHRRSSGR